MNEEEAYQWIYDRWPARMDKVATFAAMLRQESERQNLIARSTFDKLWSRHLADSAQLVPLAPASGQWIDVGTGGGLPGIVVAILRGAPVRLVEPRRKRADFLNACVDALDLRLTIVTCAPIQQLKIVAGVISARAVTSMAELFAITEAAVSRETLYVLPRGVTAPEDIANARTGWHGTFHVEQSLTSPGAGIVIASGISRR